MSNTNIVEIVNYFAMHKTPYKYAHKDVLVCVSTLLYKGNVKSIVYYQVVSSNTHEIDKLVQESLSWVYGSLKSSRFTLRQSFIFDTSSDIKGSIQLSITNYTKINKIKSTYSISYCLRDISSTDQYAAIGTIFEFDTMIPLAIGFNFSGFYEVTLKDLAIIKMNDIKFLS